MTIEDLKPGAILLLGREETGEHMEWLKTGSERLFLKRYVSERLKYDEREPKSDVVFIRLHGNPNFELSSAYQYLNSFGFSYQWKSTETHRITGSCPAHGFLTRFSESELDIIDGDVRLPKSGEVWGANKFPVFEKKSPRARLSFSTDYSCWCTMPDTSPTGNDEPRMLDVVSKMGGRIYEYPNATSMMRPVINIKNVEVEKCDKVFRPILQSPNRSETDISFYSIIK